MKRGIWILAGLVILAVGIYVGSVVFAPRVAERLRPAPSGVAPEDEAFFECWEDRVAGARDNVVAGLEALSWAAGEGDFVGLGARMQMMEDDLQAVKAALLACPTPKHPLLVSSRQKALRGIDLEILSCEYLEKGISALDYDLVYKASDFVLESHALFQEATRDIEKYQVEVLGP